MSKKNNQKEKMAPRVIVKIVILIALLASIIIIPCIISGVSYINAWNNNQVTPYAPTITKNEDGTTSETAKVSDIVLNDNTVRMEGKDFKPFNITFKATKYNDRADEKVNSVTFSVKVSKNDESPTTLVPLTSNSSYYFKSAVALCSNWIGLNSYSSSLSSYAVDSEKTMSVTLNTQFPAKASTWPIPVVVESPDCYLYLYYRTMENGKEVLHSYILRYTYSEYMTDTTEGGIRK